MDEWDERDETAGARTFACPYCWQSVEPPIDPDLEGDLVWDCEVCCRPWLIHIHRTYDGSQSVTVERAQD